MICTILVPWHPGWTSPFKLKETPISFVPSGSCRRAAEDKSVSQVGYFKQLIVGKAHSMV
jgi:hypothetical protein